MLRLYQAMLAIFAIILLSLASLISGLPAAAQEASDASMPFNSTGFSTIQSRNSSAVNGGSDITIFLEPNVKFKICEQQPRNNDMCLLSYAEKSTWGGWGSIWVHDNRCNLMGWDGHVARNWLASTYEMHTQLQWLVGIQITTKWNAKETKGVEIWYGNQYFEPLYRPYYGGENLFNYRAKVISQNEPGQIYAVFRTPFNCR